MDFIINDLSLEGQYSDIADFKKSGLPDVAAMIQEIYYNGNGLIYSKTDLYSRLITADLQFQQMLFDTKMSRTDDQIRKFKSLLAKIQSGPYWDIDAKQKNVKYELLNPGFDSMDVTLTAIAEAQARNVGLISFAPSRFCINPLNVLSENAVSSVENFFSLEDLLLSFFNNNLLSVEEFINKRKYTKLNFSKLDPKNGLNLITKLNTDLFLSAFRKIETLSWASIKVDDGLQYKKFDKNKDTAALFSKEEWERNIDKFRVGRKYRCFGNNIDGVFFLLRIDLSHKLSDKG